MCHMKAVGHTLATPINRVPLGRPHKVTFCAVLKSPDRDLSLLQAVYKRGKGKGKGQLERAQRVGNTLLMGLQAVRDILPSAFRR